MQRHQQRFSALTAFAPHNSFCTPAMLIQFKCSHSLACTCVANRLLQSTTHIGVSPLQRASLILHSYTCTSMYSHCILALGSSKHRSQLYTQVSALCNAHMYYNALTFSWACTHAACWLLRSTKHRCDPSTNTHLNYNACTFSQACTHAAYWILQSSTHTSELFAMHACTATLLHLLQHPQLHLSMHPRCNLALA